MEVSFFFFLNDSIDDCSHRVRSAYIRGVFGGLEGAGVLLATRIDIFPFSFFLLF
jgi:hypothetical protein